MRNLYFIVEGETEEAFVKRLLVPYLYGRGLVCHIQAFTVFMSGGGHGHNNTEHFLNTITPVLYYAGEPVITSLLDFFRFPRKQPAFAACAAHATAAAQAACLQTALFEAVQHIRPYPRFIPYLQLHEYEAYLFSDPTCFRHFYDQHDQQIAALQAIADAHESPELIDGGSHTAPSKRIIAELPDYDGAKSVVGPQVAELIGLETIRGRCRHFDEWVRKLEQLGGVSE